MITKLQTLKDAAALGDWKRAISIASKFQRLGSIRGAVLDAQTAYNNPRFLAQIGKDAEACIAAGKQALIDAYKL